LLYSAEAIYSDPHIAYEGTFSGTTIPAYNPLYNALKATCSTTVFSIHNLGKHITWLMFLLEDRILVDAYPIALHSFRHWYGFGEFEYLQRIDDPLTHVLFALM
jgi:hypothetical protein